jgi:CRP-like cAMP-binding protein
VRAAALHLLILEGRASAEIAGRLERDESEIVRETAKGASDRGTPASLTSIERMIALRSVPLFATLAPEPLSDLAASCGEASFAPGTTLCREGDPSREVFVLLAGDVIVVHGDGLEEVVFATEGTGSVLGEMAVLNRAPRSATVRAGANGARVLVLDGEGFRQSIYDDPTIADAVIHTLARRLGAADDVIRSLASARERGGAQDGASLRDPRSDRKAAGC